MLTTLREFFDKAVGPGPGNVQDESAIAVAAAVLLLETARAGDEITEAERAAAMQAVRTKFGLSSDAAERVISAAEAEARDATGLFPFTSLINKEFSAEQKERLIEMIWRVAYADDELNDHEMHLVRKIANLLHIPHSVYIAAKMRAKDAP
ncbi:MAG: TerB family tellurite resistance protein [Burkholderiales bacterium]|jgi:uncharacterized tellurite resistance protein B-like protein|nr:TerB family tellurite resistance protein [Burkholderiales bacterium]